ncbi:MAG: LytR C-terminal domain-containing protein [Candidatus Levybacteria bacterium]|nr:LytR C-terminal domain-containing protein [Candidatus Levybacteria bacterium]
MTSTRRPKSLENGKSLKLLLFFCVGIVIIIGVSLFVKIANIASLSLFDGKHRLTIVIDTAPAYILSFSPEDRSILVASITSKRQIEAKKIGQKLKIPVDATVSYRFKQGENIDAQLFLMLTRYASLKTELTVFDIIRLWWFAKSAPKHAVIRTDIIVPGVEENHINEPQYLTEKTSRLFTDAALAEEKLSVEVVNATGESGFGARLAKFVSHMGGNVILVTTADTIASTSGIAYYGEKSYTLSRFEKILSVSSSQLHIPGIADIVITLGRDSVGKDIF